MLLELQHTLLQFQSISRRARIEMVYARFFGYIEDFEDQMCQLYFFSHI